jgi:hypothetical protein
MCTPPDEETAVKNVSRNNQSEIMQSSFSNISASEILDNELFEKRIRKMIKEDLTKFADEEKSDFKRQVNLFEDHALKIKELEDILF